MVRQAILISRINAITTIIVTTLLLAATAAAQVPETMSFQGELSTGCQNCTQNLTFKIYNAATGGTALWNETQSVAMSSRRFNVVLGSSTALSIAFDGQYYLGITIGTGTELTPRIRLTSAPYSLRSRHADTAGYVVMADGSITAAKLASGSVTDAKIASGISYSKLSGAPASLPPNGSAGGDLNGSYPNPTIADNAVTTNKIADEAVTDAKISDVAWGKITGAPTSLTPGGSAGGDLSGNYPNPTVSTVGAKTATELAASVDATQGATDAASASAIVRRDSSGNFAAGVITANITGDVTGSATTFTGNLEGDVTSVGMTTTIADDAITSAKIGDGTITDEDVSDSAGIAYSKLSGTPTSLPPNGTAGGDLESSYPNPTVVKLRGRAISSTTPTNGQTLKWNSSSSQWTPGADDNVPAGYMIVGSSATAPAGYQYTNRSFQGTGEAWTTKASMITGRFGIAAAAVNNKVYVIGGAGFSFFESTNEEYDAVTNTWATKASMPAGRGYLAAAAVNGKVYAIGGRGATGIGTSGPVNTNYEYDPATNSWSTKATLAAAREALAAAVVNGKIYVIGGYNAGYLNTNAEYDPGTNSWSAKASMSTSRGFFAAVAVNNKIYALGGYDGTNTVNTNAEYDPSTNTWSSKSSTGFTARSSFAAAAVNNRIYVLGGFNSSSNSMNSNEEYDPATNTWATKVSLPTARGANAAAVVNSSIYVFGGGSPFGQLSTNEEYSLTGTFYLHVKQ